MPTTLMFILAAATQNFHLPKGLLSAICFTESHHNTQAFHKDDGPENSIGWCQVQLTTARGLGYTGSADGLLDAKVNATYAAKYLQRQLKRYNGESRKAVAAYNAGSFREGKKGLAKNQKYVDKVFKAWGEGK